MEGEEERRRENMEERLAGVGVGSGMGSGLRPKRGMVDSGMNEELMKGDGEQGRDLR